MMSSPEISLNLRNDLIISPPDASGAVVIKDPVCDRFFRFGPAEAAILPMLNGKTSLQDIGEKLGALFGQTVEPATVTAFIEALAARGLLAGQASPPGIKKGKRVRGPINYMRFPLHNPETLLKRLYARLAFLFTRRAAWMMALVVGLALNIALGNSDILARDMATVATLSSLPFVWLIIFLATVVHEYAHGLTCTHFGGRVREMGFMLIFFQPALYCNVSDAWLFPERPKRLLVTLAGPLSELMMWALAVLLWRVAAPETLLSRIALILIATSGFRAAINLIPLIKLDGYYILSDLTGIPNLRAKAFAYFRQKLRHPLQPIDTGLSRFQRRILFWYGLLGLIFSFWLLGFIVSLGFSFLTTNLQATGFVIGVAILTLLFRKPLILILQRLAKPRLRYERNSE